MKVRRVRARWAQSGYNLIEGRSISPPNTSARTLADARAEPEPPANDTDKVANDDEQRAAADQDRRRRRPTARLCRFVRLILEHKAAARVANLTDEQIVEQAPEIIKTMMAVVVEAGRNGDQVVLDQLAWFTEACDAEFNESRPQPRPRQHDA